VEFIGLLNVRLSFFLQLKMKLFFFFVLCSFIQLSLASLPVVRCRQETVLEISSDVEVYEFEGIETLNIPTVDCDKTSVCRLDCKHYGGSGVVIISLEQYLQNPSHQQLYNL
jgi:hypothetical protein